MVASAPVPASSATPATVTAATPPQSPVKLHFGQLVLQQGRVTYTDNFIRPNFTANLVGIQGTVGAFGTQSTTSAPVDIAAKLAANGPLSIRGTVNPLIAKPALDLTASAHDIELTNLTPYSAKYAGYPITKGKLNVDLHYKLDNDQLNANNHIFIDQLTFGDHVENDTATKLPVRLAISLLKNSRGERIIDFQKSNLHVVNYSVPFSGNMSLAALKEHLFSSPEHPDLIPYKTTYYKDTWGFCLSHRQLEQLSEDEYEVRIDSTLENGSLSYGEFLAPGATEDEILISCHACHPSLCNDNLSGVSLATFLAKSLASSPRAFDGLTRAIMTTDTRPKRAAASCRIGGAAGAKTVRVAGCAKSGQFTMRVIAGRAGGVRLVSPKNGVRPALDRVKSTICSSLGEVVIGARVLDLFAGTGSLGIEALSRGADSALFVEQDRQSTAAIEKNLAKTGLAGRVRQQDVFRFLKNSAAATEKFQIVFADPPYDKMKSGERFTEKLLVNETLPRLLQPDGVFVLEKRPSEDLLSTKLWQVTRQKTYGATEVLFLSAIRE